MAEHTVSISHGGTRRDLDVTVPAGLSEPDAEWHAIKLAVLSLQYGPGRQPLTGD